MSTKVNAVGGSTPTNGAKTAVDATIPYVAHVTLEGTADMLFHRWNVEAVDEKAKAAKGSKSKKTDDVESYVYRNDKNEICVPGEYLRGAIINAAKFRQDPRSPRKSAMDLFKAAIVSLTDLASLGKTDWDYLHRCRVTVQRAGITRSRPAILKGWQATFQLLVNIPEYVPQDILHDTIASAGRLVGLADFRPSYGRFVVVKFETGFDI